MADEDKLRIFVNSNAKMSRGKYAAQAVHAALLAVGAHPGVAVVVLGANKGQIEKLPIVVRDAGLTELDPGTVTAGTDWVHRPSPD
jgi:PTH2 family peptidyl-tRNA hydrolase